MFILIRSNQNFSQKRPASAKQQCRRAAKKDDTKMWQSERLLVTFQVCWSYKPGDRLGGVLEEELVQVVVVLLLAAEQLHLDSQGDPLLSRDFTGFTYPVHSVFNMTIGLFILAIFFRYI